MKKYIIKVPQFIRYISDWKEYSLPGGHIIVDKGVTGCGYTEYCLTNSQNIVLCSPRKLLLENKRDQHKDDLNILYLENGIQNYQGVKDIYDIIKNHIFQCQEENEAIKFMVTYDSLHYLVEFLEDNRLLEEFYFVIDEFQAIFLDSYFKSSVELDFVNVLQGCPNVLYLSATPMLEKYLDKLPEFKDLPYQILDWSGTGYVEKATILRKNASTLSSECGKIIDSYLSGKYKILLNPSGIPVASKEAVFYLNSVAEILRIVKARKLTPENTRIICSDTPENRESLAKRGFKPGKIPLKGETNPMFMFCTSTVYVGVDFYSDNARTFVFADPNISSLGTDISLDLPQIAGRQRDSSNPFKNEITIFYKTQKNPVSKEDFDFLQGQRKEKTRVLLGVYSKLQDKTDREAYLDKLKKDIEHSKYSDDFVAISEKTNLPVYNYLVEISNERAWEVSQRDYQDNISVTRALEGQGFGVENYQTGEEKIVKDFLDTKFYATGIFRDKMRMYCEFCDLHKDNLEVLNILGHKIQDPKYKMYYDYYGTQGCKAVSYIEMDLYRGLKDKTLENQLRERIYLSFKLEEKYPMAWIKETLGEIYKTLGISKTPKATDLGKYFGLKKIKMTLPDKTVVNGYKLSSLPPTEGPLD